MIHRGRPSLARRLAAPIAAWVATTAPASGPAAADPPRHIVAALPGPGGDLGKVILVGRSAELYEPAAPGPVRTVAGGVGPDVVSVVRGDDGVLWAIATQAPPFARDARGAWHAIPLANRGAVATTPGAPRMAIGRHLYGLVGGKWKRLATAPARITRLAARGKDSWLVLGDGRGFRHDGGRLAAIALPLAAGDSVVALTADDRGAVARTAAGAWLRLGSGPARPLTLASELGGLEPASFAADPAGLLLVGQIPGPGGAPRHVLARVGQDGLSLVEDLAAPAAGDGFAALTVGAGGAMLLVTRGGEIRRREPGGAWVSGSIQPDALPPVPQVARKAPSRAR